MEAIRNRPKPKRLVYAPKAYVFIHSRKLGKTIDVSDYVVSGAVNRVINQPSTAIVTLKNPDFKWINGSKGKRKRFDPAFLPMDGITIWLQRIAGKPIQVFTGYIDEIPIYQMYPENLEIKATCTLKRLLYTYFDPGTTAMTDFFVKHNWNWDPNNGLAFSKTAQNDGNLQGDGNNVPDSGMGEILKSFLIEVCHWDPQAIVIADLPKGVPDMVSRLWAQKTQISEAGYKDLQSFFSSFLTMSTGSTSDSISGSSGVVANKATIREIKNIMGDLKNAPTELPSNSAATGTSMLRPSVYDIFLASMVMTRVNKNYSNETVGIQNGTGMFAIPKDFIRGHGGSGGSQGRPQATTDYKGDITGSIKYFMTKYNEMVTSHGAAGKTSEEKIALTLSFGMGKEPFYADILKACQSDTNRSIAQGLSNTTQADTTSSTATAQNVLTAAEVRTKTNHSRVNWNQLMSGSKKANAEDYNSGSALIKNKTYKVKAEFFEDTPDASIFDETLNKTISVDLNSLRYFVIEYGRNPASRSKNSGNLGHLPFGAKIRVTNPANGNSAVAIVMDAATNTGAEMGMSRSLATSIGLMSANANSFSGDVNIEYLGDEPFKEEDLKDKSGNSYPVKRKSIIAKSKTLGPGASKKQFLTINEADHDAYTAYYEQKKTSEILAEYFFVANDMGLRLAIPQETSSNLVLLVQNDNPNQGSNALKQYATWASSQEGTKYVGYSDDTNLYKYSRGAQASSTSLKSTSSDRGNHIGPDLPEIYTYQTVVQIDQNAPHPIYDGDIVVDPTTDTTTTGTDVTWQDLVKLNISAAFTTMFSLPVNALESQSLTGDKALMNDIPVYQGVQQFVLGSMRQFMSLPNGQFCAFYPDQFGTLGRTPYWNMYDVEIEDLKINLNDTELVTHMYVNGPVSSSGQQPISFLDKITSAGVVTIEDAISAGGFITSLNDVNPKSGPAAGSSKEKLKETYDFLQTFGARPFVKDEPLIRNHYFEFITAYNLFQYHWARFHATTAKVSFQPELIAGGIVAFPDHALNLYVDQVSHSWDYSAGFQTQAVFSCPSTQIADENPGFVIFNYGQQK